MYALKTHKHHMNDPTRSIGHIYVITNYIWKILLLLLIVWSGVCFKCLSLILIEFINLDDFFSVSVNFFFWSRKEIRMLLEMLFYWESGNKSLWFNLSYGNLI